MKFGLVVLGAHIGIHIKDEISKIKDSSILLVEPVPHNTVSYTHLTLPTKSGV